MDNVERKECGTTANPWTLLPSSAPYILPCDAQAVADFNARAGDRHRLQTSVLPEPYLGNPMAPVVLLNLNPGWNAAHDPINHARPQFIHRNRQNLLHESHPFPFYLLDPDLLPHRTPWWDRRLKQLITATSREVVARGVFCAEYFPYHSKSFKKGALLPSQEYTFDLVRRAIERGAVVLLMRSKRLWLDAVPKLVSYDRLFEANSSQWRGTLVQTTIVATARAGLRRRSKP